MNETASETASAGARQRSLADFQPLHAAEAKVVAGLGSGDFNRIGNGLCPEADDPARTVRAELCACSSLATATAFVCTRKD